MQNNFKSQFSKGSGQVGNGASKQPVSSKIIDDKIQFAPKDPKFFETRVSLQQDSNVQEYGKSIVGGFLPF